ncbi:hypothetical protein SPRG_03729 [Saprolegnia parasitica CBS 223.65]|uniref:Methionine synthase reductase n=1 Tax=Saprolegnia parasitica (strain CBS 223.65) TaxID=695850 RepID=A0A067CM98_SAPPC|nr:hypothetical protein SPRG_03729 [Saprolegnia parasitica CBS 223.65]KDO31809.1 hypothetical protein SPRG_03729 [Saprolegnia parasitica CBS 223.65]|eukprot:XP_012197689.1 hypothetical protein SPRG_03729 [Saprolegnia parasitica CBS 223.65]
MVDATTPLYVFYGSQTGCAESIAERLQSDAIERNVPCHEVRPLDAFEKSGVLQDVAAKVVIVCSTTGNGDPPGNAEKFWRYIKKRAHPATLLSSISFTVLGLGDTNYDKFCHMGKSIFRRMKDLGAVSFYDLGCADEAMGLEDSVEPWIDGFWPALLGASTAVTVTPIADDTTVVAAITDSMAAVSMTSAPALLPSQPFLASFESLLGDAVVEPDAAKLPRLHEPSFSVSLLAPSDAIAKTVAQVATDTLYSASSPFLAAIASARYLTTPASIDRTVFALDFDLANSGMTYAPGDVLGVNCPNDDGLVAFFLQRLQLSAFADHQVQLAPIASSKKKVSGMPFPAHATLRDVVRDHLDLAALPKKATLRALAPHCADAKERTRRRGCFKTFIDAQYLSVLEVLSLFPSCHPPLPLLLSLMPRLSPRYYSIASSPLASPTRATIALTRVAYTQHGIPRHGLCSNWLHDVAFSTATTRIPIFLKPATDFVLPDDASRPLVLIGPGTGVAPFMGFVQHRSLQAASTPIHLFFGCRSKTQDFLFGDELQRYADSGVLTTLALAFSRDQAEKHYVQHELALHGATVYDALAKANGMVYVCGDGMHMARDVHEALVSVFESHGTLSRDDAEAQLKQLALDARYVRDIWC